MSLTCDHWRMAQCSGVVPSGSLLLMILSISWMFWQMGHRLMDIHLHPNTNQLKKKI